MAEKMDIAKKKCLTPFGRVSFPQVFKAKAFEGQEPKFSMTLIFDASTDLSAMKKCAYNAAAEKWGPDKDKWPKKLKMPFRDGEDREMEGYGAGKIFVAATSKTRPGLVDAKRQAIISESDFYAGCWARMEVIAFAYDHAGNRGVSFSLQNIQKWKDDKAFSGRKAAEDTFDAIDDGSDDEDNYDLGGDDKASSGELW